MMIVWRLGSLCVLRVEPVSSIFSNHGWSRIGTCQLPRVWAVGWGCLARQALLFSMDLAARLPVFL